MMPIHARRWIALTAAAGATASMISCSDRTEPDLVSPDTTAPVSTPTPTVDPVHQEILDVYHGALDAMLDAHQAGDPEHSALEAYLLERSSALHNLENTIRRNEDHDLFYDGTLHVVSAVVTDLAMDERPATATIESCVDYSEYELVRRGDGTPVEAEEPLGRYRVTTELLLGTDDRWYVATQTAHWDEPC